jgi:hypothetical protein
MGAFQLSAIVNDSWDDPTDSGGCEAMHSSGGGKEGRRSGGQLYLNLKLLPSFTL